MTRHIDFEAIENFRDFGDYAAGPGRLRRGRLYRSANQSRATDSDLKKLAALGISTIVDLRRPNERQRDPCRRWQGFTAQVIENDTDDGRDDEWRRFLNGSDLSPGSFRDYMTSYYREAPFWDRHIDLFGRYFRALAEADRPILVHCAAGKDRTGILCALTHHLAGVEEADIRADFLLTNDPERMRRRLPWMRDHIHEVTGRMPPDEGVLAGLAVELAYLDEAFAAIRGRYGSVDDYLEEALGLEAATRREIHLRLVA